ncbi:MULTISPECIES: endonuclease III [Clostridium]|jgi:endonuclease-3|uniref:Endonuclease III n=2 Tax=Clostridium TaxID=1485 RepID=A0A151AN78_9CLOT|nr:MULTISPECIES: endonuclease III [Clostridium]KYH29082.1 ultraviolet N-glycosylase/AP lyase [Clostridium colicanis DSM 13634]MBE6043807.1 endonuclease III [Clostridium thermopalmarium]PRR74410.1 Ultraviolet N-glycosylase/AP lyase [Clostridium thermopalmarium DSM 5974]PVZ21643.1 DNA-(apurinic or apyrimidinic site) lyase /endonuclease III [Clostridium thermopalmarium DSM 5974]
MKKNVDEILDILEKIYPDAQCELIHENPFQLLIATVLSAQTTDKKVNQVTEKLFKKYKTPNDFAVLEQDELEKEIREIGLYKNKAKNIIGLCKMLIDDYNGEVPRTMEELIKLPGVGRKTANVVLSNAFGVPAIAVDTHVFRVANRIGIANSNNVEGTEEQLRNNIPMERWSKAHHLLIFHGRRTCAARKPKCENCPLAPQCKYLNGEQ